MLHCKMVYFNAFPSGALWLLQVCPLKVAQTVNQIPCTFHRIGSYSAAEEHTAFTDTAGGGIYLCSVEETLLNIQIYALRQVVV